MKHLLLIATIIILSLQSKAQYEPKCELEDFHVATFFMQYINGIHGAGGGIELGLWGGDNHIIGIFGGAELGLGSIPPNKNKSYYQDTALFRFYAKGQIAIVRMRGTFGMYATVTPALDNFQYFNTGVGLRFLIPLSQMISAGVEPEYHFFHVHDFTVRFNVHIALN